MFPQLPIVEQAQRTGFQKSAVRVPRIEEGIRSIQRKRSDGNAESKAVESAKSLA